MNDNSIVILKEWYLAHEDAKQNAALMCSQKSSVEESRRITNECAARMDRCFAADEKLFKVEDIPLVTLFKNQGQGCGSCMYKSNLSKVHAECRREIDFWFAYRAALMVFAEILCHIKNEQHK